LEKNAKTWKRTRKRILSNKRRRVFEKGTTDAINQLILQSNAEYNRETTVKKRIKNEDTLVEPSAKRIKIAESNDDKLINSLEEGLRTKVKILLGAIAAKDNDFGYDLTKNKILREKFRVTNERSNALHNFV